MATIAKYVERVESYSHLQWRNYIDNPVLTYLFLLISKVKVKDGKFQKKTNCAYGFPNFFVHKIQTLFLTQVLSNLQYFLYVVLSSIWDFFTHVEASPISGPTNFDLCMALTAVKILHRANASRNTEHVFKVIPEEPCLSFASSMRSCP